MQEEREHVVVDPMTCQPVKLWAKYRMEGRVRQRVQPMRLDTPVYPDKVRFVCISDTHEKLGHILHRIPPGDVLIHSGDFTNRGEISAVIKFNQELASLPHKHKIVIAGNHEVGFDPSDELMSQTRLHMKMLGVDRAYDMLTNCTYIFDKEITLYGIHIYGSPWHPMPGWSFYRDRGQPLLSKWHQIPDRTDVLITHTPPLGHGDGSSWTLMDGILAGCAELLNTVEMRVKPKYHVFGHIHEKNGVTSNMVTTFINCAINDSRQRPAYDPVIFDVPLPKGFVKEPPSPLPEL